MENGIASWGVELSLFRTAVGQEFEIIRRLKRSPLARDSIFFGAYGYFDLAAIHCLSDLSTPSLLPLDCDIVEAAPFRFFADNANEPKANFLRSLKIWKTAIAVFFKIAPSIFSRAPNEIRWQTAQLVRENFKGSHVFFGLGFSEIFLLFGGDDLPAMLNKVTNFRYAPQKEKAFKRQLQIAGTDYFFVKSATFPFVSYENIHRKHKFHLLKGEMYPVVTVSCDPASEGPLVKQLPPEMEVRNSYGDTDLVIYWKERKVLVSEFAKALTKIRDLAEPIGSVQKTTSYLETPALQQDTNLFAANKTTERPERLSKSAAATFGLIDALEPQSLRASVTDLWLRLMPCLSNPHLESGYLDMANTFKFIKQILDEIAAPKTTKLRNRDARFELTLVCDLARIAINQRYAGLETHPETLAHSQSPILSDIRSMISAASCQPRFIFSNIFPNVPAEQVWSGYVIFGTTYSHQWYPQDILALPAVALYDPISEWWKTTHETAHAVYRLLKLQQRTPKKIYRLVDRVYGNTTRSTTQTLQELFANWFDWRHTFNRDTSFFLEVIWKSWLEIPIVWRKKSQYLTRTFTIFLAQDLQNFHRVSERGNNELIIKYIPAQWKCFTTSITQNLPEFKSYISQITKDELSEIFGDCVWLIPAVYFYDSKLEIVCQIQGLGKRLNPPYPKLAQHLQSLESGMVITDPIPNPCRLQVELLRCSRNNHHMSFRTQAAFVFSLENSYLLAATGSEI
jgi:hypothetical protein